MKVILDEMLAVLSRGERVVLCSILASSGSVPRGAGAKMAVLEDGRVLGTIGGGAVERLSIQRAQDALKNGGSNELKSYNLHPSEVAEHGHDLRRRGHGLLSAFFARTDREYRGAAPLA